MISLPAAAKGPSYYPELNYPDDSGFFKGSRLKGQCRKIRYPENQPTPLKLSNRFDGLVNAESPENFHNNSGSSDRKSTGSSRKGHYRGSSNTLKSNTKSSSPQNSSNSEISDNGSVESSNKSSENIRNIGTVTSKDTSATGIITMDIPFQSGGLFMKAECLDVGTQVTFDLEYISGKPIATGVRYHTHNLEKSSSGNQSDTYD